MVLVVGTVGKIWRFCFLFFFIFVAFCSKRVWNLVLVFVFGSVVLWMGFILPLKDKAEACGGDKRSIHIRVLENKEILSLARV